ncbi:NTPase KAP [Jeongeupia chitinilytica]|uniref:KAP NTPase domain-containing protein n=1 Tax=Jeongeupia chitinilytica TaxID=1041641 RepID=A0ABQ3H5E9_9NEIS|nr:NTPase KAP [Jeongeupia chitinilytica]GHD68288.1 hypothetical protein GCM10007350_33190 [Jeongeupia chitinilytica]
MTLAKCKQNFIELVGDADNRVIALSGKWGTGKSHLWKEVQQAGTTDKEVEGAIYTSLFGLSTIAELKLKIAQGVLPELKSGDSLAEAIKNGYSGAKKILKSIHSGFSALDELALIAAPMMIKGRFIVIDDIERKHDKLSIDEILGFVDDCVQNLDCRILLILNSDHLGDKKLWELFREKVIDHELRLDTSPSEAFDIAAALTPTSYSAHIKSAVEACQIANIRIIRKIIRVVNRLLANREPLPPEVLLRVIPSATLLSAIHYKGLDDGPDFDFVLGFQGRVADIMKRESRKQGEEETPEVKAKEGWGRLLDKLGVHSPDEFEALVVGYLKSGLIEGELVGRIIDRYMTETQMLATRRRMREFFDRSIWRVDLTEAELLDELRALLPDVGLLDMFAVTTLHDQAMDLAGGARLAQDLIDNWLITFQRQHPPGHEPDLSPDFNFFSQPLHPKIEAEIRAVQARRQSTTTLLEVCKKISEDQGWGPRETTFMKSVTPADYEAAIAQTTGADLKLILLQSMELLTNRGMYAPHFGGAPQSFLDASRTIVQRDPDSRLSKLIRSLFHGRKMESELITPVAAMVAGEAAAP